MEKTTIQIKYKTRQILNLIKAQYNLKSYDELLRLITNNFITYSKVIDDKIKDKHIINRIKLISKGHNYKIILKQNYKDSHENIAYEYYALRGYNVFHLSPRTPILMNKIKEEMKLKMDTKTYLNIMTILNLRKGTPDLLIYKNYDDWFFSEVKTINDTIMEEQERVINLIKCKYGINKIIISILIN